MLDGRMRRRFTTFEVGDWPSSAVVFAPHPDDETLGCGGVAHKMMRSGALVRFVFVTDGAASHPGKFQPEVMRKTREAEAIEAVRRLGASSDKITFLRFPDGVASEHVGAITGVVETLLNGWRPQGVFVVHAKDPSPDHAAVNVAVRAAIQSCGCPMTVFEYPVWYWYHWPWVTFRGDLPGMWPRTLRQTVRTVAGLRTLLAFNTQAYVGDVLDVKREALASHASQTRRVVEDDDWLTLGDLSGGDFLTRLLGDYETFTRYEVNGRSNGSSHRGGRMSEDLTRERDRRI